MQSFRELSGYVHTERTGAVLEVATGAAAKIAPATEVATAAKAPSEAPSEASAATEHTAA